MDHYDFELICLGCGPAGEKAATQAAYYQKRSAIVERLSRPGGAMVNTGTIPSKALRETALLCSAFRRRPLPGVELELDHRMSVPRFMARRHLIEQQEHDRIESSMDRHDITVVRGHGRLVDPHTVEVESPDGKTTRITGRFILIATGSSPVRPGHIDFQNDAVVDADQVLELQRLPETMIIVGAGVIGCEYASVFAEMGTSVTLVDPRSDVLPFIDAECRDQLLQAMRDRGVTLKLQSKVERVVPQDAGGVEVVCEEGTSMRADVLLWAAGRSSNTADVGLDTAGVETGHRGIINVDAHYCTNVPSIYAAGDVIGFPALASTSMEQGRIAACHMFGIGFKQSLATTIPIGIYTIPGVSSVGPTAEEAAKAGHDVVIGKTFYRNNVRGRMLGDESGIVKCVFERGSRKLLGVTIVGEMATELIHLGQSLISLGVGVDYLINACFNYPSLSELYKYAAYDALQNLAADEGRAGELGKVA